MEIAGQNISTRGDIAAAGIGYAVGYAIDNYFFPGGLTGGIVAAISATGAVGVKNLFHALWSSLREPVDELPYEPAILRDQAETLLEYIRKIVDRSENPKAHPLREGLEQYERMIIYWKNGVISNEEFYSKVFVPARQAFRTHLDSLAYVWVG